jgi:hypothetical protein
MQQMPEVVAATVDAICEELRKKDEQREAKSQPEPTGELQEK